MSKPNFWTRISKILKCDENELNEVKEVLFALGYNNIAAIAKLKNKPYAISSLELEFQKMKENANINFKLKEIGFGSGTAITISEIAKAATKCFNACEDLTEADKLAIKNELILNCQKVHRGIAADSVSFHFDENVSCEVVCPVCKDKIVLSSYQRTSMKDDIPPLCFKTFNFERHLSLVHSTSASSSTSRTSNQERPKIGTELVQDYENASGQIIDVCGTQVNLLLTEQCTELVEQQSDPHWKNASLEQISDEVRSKIDILKSEVDHKDVSLAKLQSEIVNLRTQISEMCRNDVAISKEQLESNQNVLLESLQHELRDLKALLDQKDSIIKELQSNDGAITADRLAVIKWKNEVAHLRKLVFSLQKDVTVNLCSFMEIKSNATIDIDEFAITIQMANGIKKRFSFDRFYNGTPDGDKLDTLAPILTTFSMGKSICIAMHGETGSGKSTTMFGANGILKNAVNYLLDKNNCVQLSFIELYGKQFYDLMGKNEISVSCSEKAIVAKASKIQVKTVRELDDPIKVALGNRSTKSTNQNLCSSRSHAIIIIEIPGKTNQLVLLDLAGFESTEQKENMHESISINGALSHFNKLMLDLKRKCVPNFGGHQLTRVLQPILKQSKIIVYYHISEQSIAKYLNMVDQLMDARIVKRPASSIPSQHAKKPFKPINI